MWGRSSIAVVEVPDIEGTILPACGYAFFVR
jgi:hypothetical protein